jgi:hypothetical protein
VKPTIVLVHGAFADIAPDSFNDVFARTSPEGAARSATTKG